MNLPNRAFEPRNLFRNVYFWLAIGGAIFLLYVAFIAFTFLPRSTSEVTNENTNKTENIQTNEQKKSNETPIKNISSKVTGALSGVKISLIKHSDSGWVDSDDRKMTIVVKILNLKKDIIGEIIRSGGIEIEIDGVKAAIINSEPFQGNRILTRAEAVLSSEKFEKFKAGETQTVEIKTVLRYGNDSATDFENARFAKRKDNKTDVEGVKIDWK